MPTVLRFGGFRVVIYPNDHRPGHVHVMAAGGEAVFELRCPDGPVRLREVYGLPRASVAQIRRNLDAALPMLCDRWRSIHGEP